ncbi:MAG TPA: carbohydrate kinase family protein [Syntrophorhabdaceae bacterium]|nr:carbohydrate kinase family protein [Syntrophorhabdaceae bacterium]HQM80140.1 carbohydrate kinase family protein [Syntrophorhabdaceae bacterium]
MDVIGIGALNLDFIYEVQDMGCLKTAGADAEAGKEIVGGDDMLEGLRDKLNRFGTLKKVAPGGSASNTCHVLSRMGFDVGLIGVLGEDREGDFYLKQLPYADKGTIVRRGRSGMAYIVNTPKRDRSIIVIPNSNSDLTVQDVGKSDLSGSRWVHMTSYVKDQAMEAQLYIKKQISGKVPFSIDPGEIYAAMGEKIYPLIDGAEILFTTEKELVMLFGDDIDQARQKALGMVNIVVMKKGKKGASLFTNDNGIDSQAGKVRVVDNTGAGDVLNGVFLGLYMQGKEPAAALGAAVKAASISTTGFGRDAYPDAKMVEKLLHGNGNRN